jgi:hypothetical protein
MRDARSSVEKVDSVTANMASTLGGCLRESMHFVASVFMGLSLVF